MQEPKQGQAPPTPELIFDTLLAYQRSSALSTAIELDIFGAIGDGLGDAGEIAARSGASERGTRILCDFLVICGLLGKENGRYRHSPTSALFLDPKSPACLASIARFLYNPEFNAIACQLTQIVRDGRTTLPGEGTVEPDNPVWVAFAENMAPMMAPMAGPFGALVLEGLNGPVRVLDIAAGHGLFGIAVAKQNPQARITGQDWAAVLEVARRNAGKAGVADRYDSLPGSAFDVEYGGPFDAVLLTNFLHHFDPPTCVALLKKVRSALRPGGKAATLEFVPNEDRVSPPMAAAFSMTMLLSTAHGDAYTFAELSKMYKEAGFKSVTAQGLPMSPSTAVLGVA